MFVEFITSFVNKEKQEDKKMPIIAITTASAIASFVATHKLLCGSVVFGPGIIANSPDIIDKVKRSFTKEHNRYKKETYSNSGQTNYFDCLRMDIDPNSNNINIEVISKKDMLDLSKKELVTHIYELREDNKKLHGKIDDLKREKKSLKSKVSKLTQEVQRLNTRVDTLVEENRGLSTRVDTLLERDDALVEQNNRLRTRVDTLVEENQGLSTRVDTLLERNDALFEQNNQILQLLLSQNMARPEQPPVVQQVPALQPGQANLMRNQGVFRMTPTPPMTSSSISIPTSSDDSYEHIPSNGHGSTI